MSENTSEMGRVDFYVLKRADAKARFVFACRLTEKAYLKDYKILVLADDETEARNFDAMLWTFSDDSFVPHQIVDASTPPDSATPVYIGTRPDIEQPIDLVLNLGNHPPEALLRFPRIAEIIDTNESRKRLGRERFKSYRERGLSLETHQLDE